MGVIERIDFERLRAGEYGDPTAHLRRYINLPSPRGRGQFRSLTRAESFAPLEKAFEAELGPEMAEIFTASEAPEEISEPCVAVPKLGSLHVTMDVPEKPDAVTLLEQLLTTEYHMPVRVTRIRDLPQTRKKVKEVCILKGNALGRVWVLHDDPKVLYKELVVSYFASREHVPTGKPLAFSPDAPFKADIGILGGSVIEHAGDAYGELLKRLERAPDIMLQTALGVARVLAQCHVGLQKSKDRLEQYGIEAPKYSFERALQESLGRVLHIENPDIGRLTRALYTPQRSYAVNHGDVHIGNIVTIAQNGSSNSDMCIDQFGLIDWSDLCSAHPIRDIIDFWVHHLREARSIFPRYEDALDKVISEYSESMQRLSGNSLSCPRADELLVHRIQRDVLELFDPARTGKKDIEDKAVYHAREIVQSLHAYHAFNALRAEAIGSILAGILAPVDYLAEHVQRMKA